MIFIETQKCTQTETRPVGHKAKFQFCAFQRNTEILTGRNTDANVQRNTNMNGDTILVKLPSWAQSQIPLLCFCAGDHRRESGTPLLSKGLDCPDCTSFRVKTQTQNHILWIEMSQKLRMLSLLSGQCDDWRFSIVRNVFMFTSTRITNVMIVEICQILCHLGRFLGEIVKMCRINIHFNDSIENAWN